MAQDEKNGSEQLLNYIRGYIPLTDETLKTIENLTFTNPILIIGMGKVKVEHAVKYIHTVIENPYTSANLPTPSVEEIMLKGHFEGKSDGLLQRVVTINEEIQEESYHKTILKKHFDERETELKNYSCIGKNESEIENALFLSANALIKHYQGEILFVKGLRIPRILERLADTHRSPVCGKLIINVPDMDIIPKEIKDQFEVINLEPEKQVQATEHITPTAQNLASIPPAKDENVFRWCGGTWQMKFDNKEIYLPDSFGLRYIHHLLKHPNREIHVNDLKQITANAEEAKQLLKSKGKNVGTAEGLKETNIKHDLLDQDAIVEYNNRIKQLKREKEDAEELGNDEKVAKIQEEIETIEGELKSSMGIGGTSRKFTDATEKNRVAITNCIRDALCKLEKKHPSLQEHLKAIETGEKCAYKPENNIDWNL